MSNALAPSSGVKQVTMSEFTTQDSQLSLTTG